MPDRFDACLAFTLREEGGYVDDPADPGGATNMGITLATYRQWSDDPALGARSGPGHDGADRQSDLPIALLEPVAGRRSACRRRSQRFRYGRQRRDMGIGAAAAARARLHRGSRSTAASVPKP